MRASTIIILAVCLFSVAFANSKDTESANSLDNKNSKVQEAESKNPTISLETAAAAGEEPKDAKNPRKPKRKRKHPKSPPGLPWNP